MLNFKNRQTNGVFHFLWRRIFCCWLFYAGSAGALASGDFLTEAWTMERGLPDSSVTAIAQTPDGYLWIGTYNGLARFDGINFVTFDPENTPALARARIRQLYLDHQGALWINTFDGSLTRLQDGKFSREWTAKVQNDRDNPMVVSSSNSIAFVLDRGDVFKKNLAAPAGAGWEQLAVPNHNLLTTEFGDGQCLAWFNGAATRTWTIHLWQMEADHFQPMTNVADLQGQRVRHIAPIDSKRFWVGTDAELALWNGSRFLNAAPTNGGAQDDFKFICPASDGGVWAIVNDGLRKLVNGAWTCAPPELRQVFGNLGNRFGMIADRQGGVWIYSSNQGVIHASANGEVWRLKTEGDSADDRATCLFRDREGSLWAGFELAGLVRIREGRFQQPALGKENAARSVRSVCTDAAGNVWIATIGGGLVRWNPSGPTNFIFPGGVDVNWVVSCCPDDRGRLWASAGGEKLYVCENGKFQIVTPPVPNVKAILAARSGTIWAGTRNGLFVSDGTMSNSFHQVADVGSQMIRAMAEDSAGNIWCGGDDGTLYRIGVNTTEAFRFNGGSQVYAIWSLFPDADGTIWIGTFRGGLLRFKDGGFTRFTRQQGLPDDVISQILADDEGNLWLGSHQGIFRVARSELSAVAEEKSDTVKGIVFGRADGLPTLECSGGYQPGAWRAADGRLWFATLKGAVSVQPREVQPNLLPPPVLIQDVLADGKSLEIDSGKNTALKLPPGKGQMEFHFAALSFISPERIRYRYQLVGEDSTWVEAGDRRFAHYSSLPPGNYSFKVTACNADGAWNQDDSVFAFKILPHFYETFWFHLLIAASAAGLIFAIARQRFKVKLRRQTEQLERRNAIERERARIAKDMHDDLGSSLTHIAVLGDLARLDKDNGRVEKMSATARQAVKSLDEIVWAVNPRNDKLEDLVDYIGGHAVEYLGDAGIRCWLDAPNLMAREEFPSNIRYNIFLTVKEALQNIVKHSQATEVWLRIQITRDKLTIVIRDNGCGFEVAPDDTHVDGLRNMRQRMNDIGGACRIQGRTGSGTEVILEISFQKHGARLK
jgi:signal transduction histidine kinase/ligand-binding sensor domain-containing protein